MSDGCFVAAVATCKRSTSATRLRPSAVVTVLRRRIALEARSRRNGSGSTAGIRISWIRHSRLTAVVVLAMTVHQRCRNRHIRAATEVKHG